MALQGKDSSCGDWGTSLERQTWSESMAKIQSTFRVLAAKYPDLRLRLEFAEKRGAALAQLKASEEESEREGERERERDERGATTERERD